MATKSQKKQAQRYKEKEKARAEHIKNLSPNEIVQMENYATYQILYMNDAACNACKFLAEELKTIPYKSKAVSTVYGALMKRVNAYWDFVNSTVIDKYSLAELFGEMDNYLEEPIADFRKSMIDYLAEKGIPQSHWVASVECASTLCDYATQTAKHIISSLSKVSPNAHLLKGLIIEEIFKVARSMSETVQQIHVGKTVVNLNEGAKIASSFRKVNRAFVNPRNFIRAAETADAANEVGGRMRLM